VTSLLSDFEDYQVENGTYLARKTDKAETERQWEEMKKYALYDDLKDLYAKVMPPLAGFDAKMDMMAQGYEQAREMIRRYDEVILDKANKTSIKEIQEHFKLYSRITSIEKIKQDIDIRFEEAQQKHETL
jgi:hypothetical protein